MRIQLFMVSLYMLSVAGSLQAGNVSPHPSDEVLQDEKIDNADPYGTGEVDDDIIIDDEEDTNDDEGVTPTPPPPPPPPPPGK